MNKKTRGKATPFKRWPSPPEDKEKIDFGYVVEDKVTGFTGIVVARVVYNTGCVQYGVKQRVGDDGKMTGVEYIDEGELRVIAESKEELASKHAEAPDGGIMADAPKR